MLDELEPKPKQTSDGYTVTIPHEKITVGAKTFQVKGYKGDIPIKSKTASELVVLKQLAANKKLDELPDKAEAPTPKRSLFQYCVDMGLPVSTWLPKELYESLQPKAPEKEKAPEQEKSQKPQERDTGLPGLPGLPSVVGVPIFGLVPLAEQEKVNGT